ncbi:dienelactone hydrolase family-domain-containing protein [Hyaloraphidium curvatum]|nr:dienelactone hydrolase family-domain-containing protein [Hyaloraphidium curvatum]
MPIFRAILAPAIAASSAPLRLLSAAKMSSGCCPPNSEPYLKADYATKGATTTLPSGVEAYVVGPKDAKKAILVIPDVWGWNSGRVRAIADNFGDGGYRVVVPKLLTPPLEGGTDGDALPPDFDIEKRMMDLVGYLKKFPFASSLKPKVASCLKDIKAGGADKIGMIGYCWGGWVIAHTAADPAAGPLVNAAAIFHPSIHLEDGVWGGKAAELLGKSSAPMLFCPAENDPPVYIPGGPYYDSLKKVQPATASVPFKGVQHGFVNRGDLAAPGVKEAVGKAIDDAAAFFSTTLGSGQKL